MGKTDKKSATKVAAAAVQTAKGKREAEEALEKLASAKKQKIDQAKVEAALKKEEVKKQAEQKNLKEKKDETSSSEESDSSEDEKMVKQVTKKPQTVAKPALKESSSDESSSDEELAPKKQTIASNKVQAVDDSDSSEDDSDDDKVTNVPKKAESSSSDDSCDEDEDDVKQKSVPAKQVAKHVTVAKANGSVPASKKDGSSDSSEEESSDSDDEKHEKVSAQGNKVPIAASKGASKKDESSDESSDESDSEEGADLEMVDASPVTAEKPAVPSHDKKAAAPLSGATKTIFVGNLPYSAEQSDLETFFKDVGEVVDVRFSVDHEDGRRKGFGHVEFASAEQAQKAVELNGEFLDGRALKIDLARERGSHTPASKEGNYSSYRDGVSDFAGKVFVRGFDTSGGFDQIRTALEEQFSACGEVSKISIPKDFESGEPKGVAFVCFKDTDGFNKALELNGTDIGGYPLVVEEARPRDSDGPGSSRGRGRDGGRFSDRRDRGGDRGRGRGSFNRQGRGGDRGRGRGSFNRQGRGGDRGRGRGSFNRSNVGTGKKSTFGDY